MRPSRGRQRPRSVLERPPPGNPGDHRSACIAWKKKAGLQHSITTARGRGSGREGLTRGVKNRDVFPTAARHGFTAARERPSRSGPVAPSDDKTLPAAALTLGLGVLELEGLVQALLDEIHQGPIDQRQT